MNEQKYWDIHNNYDHIIFVDAIEGVKGKAATESERYLGYELRPKYWKNGGNGMNLMEMWLLYLMKIFLLS